MDAEMYKALPPGGVAVQDRRKASLSLFEAPTKTNPSQKSLNPQLIISSQFGDLLKDPNTGPTLQYLSQETDPDLFWHGLLNFGQAQEYAENLKNAARIYQFIATQDGNSLSSARIFRSSKESPSSV